MTYSNLALNLELGQEILVGKNNEKAIPLITRTVQRGLRKSC